MINTAAELDALPVGSVVVEGDHTTPDFVYRQFAMIPGVFHRFPDGWYVVAGYGAREVPLPATVLHDPSVPAPVVSDAAVRVVADELKAHYGPLGDPDEGTLCDCGAVVAPVDEYGVKAWREHVAGAVLAAALPLLGAVPSATREELSALLLTFLRPPKHGGSWTYSPDEAADALLARFTITPRTDR